MNTFLAKITTIYKDPTLRRRIVFTIVALIVFRLLAAIPVPGINTASLSSLIANNQLFGLLDLFSGGGISRLSIVMLGVGPYITASIIIQLLTMMVPSLKNMMHDEGEAGRAKLSQYSRVLSVPLAMLQALGFILLLESPAYNIIPHLGSSALILNVIVATAGSVLLMWIGELISEFGVGNGVSLIIFAGIIARLPGQLPQLLAQFQTAGAANVPLYILALVIAVIVIGAVVFITEAERSVPVTYAKQVRGNKVYGGVSTYLPLRLNQAGVIPIIFALSILIVPATIANFFISNANTTIASVATTIVGLLNPSGWTYGLAYFILVFLFTYFYTAVTFDPQQISENLQKSGAFIPGVRPGDSTMQYLARVVTRITLVGALFLGVIAILPLIMQGFTGGTSFAIGGTALLIVVSVVIDLIKKVDAQIAMREY
ncbi:MAG: preprotein translocase subunit SecY [Patescibacteria group bacterium]|nr:preprotein translocase subunit SecY [Patescibacteria group bacterium]